MFDPHIPTKGAIHDQDEFLETFEPGDTFWAIKTFCGYPEDIQKITIELLEPCSVIEGEYIYTYNQGEHRPWGYVSRVVDEFHGVYRTEQEAQAGLLEKKIAWDTDPELIDYHITAKASM